MHGHHDRESTCRVHVTTLLSVPHRGPGKPREPSGISVHHLRIRRERGRERGKERTGRRAVGICLWRPRGYPVYEAGTRWEPARHYHPNRRLVRLESPGFQPWGGRQFDTIGVLGERRDGGEIRG